MDINQQRHRKLWIRQYAASTLQRKPLATFNVHFNDAGLPNRISEEIVETYAWILDAVASGDFSDAFVSLVRWLEI
jgi:hypothetical protein